MTMSTAGTQAAHHESAAEKARSFRAVAVQVLGRDYYNVLKYGMSPSEQRAALRTMSSPDLPKAAKDYIWKHGAMNMTVVKFDLFGRHLVALAPAKASELIKIYELKGKHVADAQRIQCDDDLSLGLVGARGL